jgi:Enoyl-CoA hydratase/isomerase
VSTTDDKGVLTLERRGHVLLERDEDLRCGVLFAHGEHFTGGLDLAEVGPALAEGNLSYPDDARDPWRNDGKPWTTPVIGVAQGWCMTLGIELLLAADIRLASPDVRFAQLEIQRGIYPFGGDHRTRRAPVPRGRARRDDRDPLGPSRGPHHVGLGPARPDRRPRRRGRPPHPRHGCPPPD